MARRQRRRFGSSVGHLYIYIFIYILALSAEAWSPVAAHRGVSRTAMRGRQGAGSTVCRSSWTPIFFFSLLSLFDDADDKNGKSGGHQVSAGGGQFRESRISTTTISTLEKEGDRMMGTSLYPFNSESCSLFFLHNYLCYAVYYMTIWRTHSS